MSTQPPTPNIGLVLPVPNSGQPWRTTDYNTLFTTIDTAFGADRTRLDGLEDATDPAGIGAKGIPAGSTSARDAFWGIPSDDAGGVALQAKGARWFNTDIRREQVYYGKYDKTTNPFGWFARGWHADLRAATVVDPQSVTVGGGAATVNSDGSVTLNAVTSQIDLKGIGWPLFRRLKFILRGTPSVTMGFNLSFLRGTAVDSTAKYSMTYWQTAANGTTGGGQNTLTTSMSISAQTGGRHFMEVDIDGMNPNADPATADLTVIRSHNQALATASATVTQDTYGVYDPASQAQPDGIRLALSAGSFTGSLILIGTP